MGGSFWDAGTYAASTGHKVASGAAFGYDKYAKATGASKAHETLDPAKRNALGENIRESRDNDDHPTSTPIITGWDATGSMGGIPRQVQKDLAGLFGLLLRKAYVTDPQIAIAAYGDAFCDRVPLQFSQFESDNRIDDNLDNLFLEGGGGGNGGETATLLWYYAAHHTVTDSFDKRGKKGYLFMVADEIALDLTPDQVKKHINPDEVVTSSLTTAGAAKALQEKWETYILLVDNSTAKWQHSEAFYTKLFGKDHVIVLESTENISETIGAALGYLEGAVTDADALVDDLVTVGGTDKALALRTVKGVAHLRGKGQTLVAQGRAALPVDEEDMAFL